MQTCMWLCKLNTTTCTVKVDNNNNNRCLACIYMDACSGQWPRQSVYITTEQTVTCLHHIKVR